MNIFGLQQADAACSVEVEERIRGRMSRHSENLRIARDTLLPTLRRIDPSGDGVPIGTLSKEADVSHKYVGLIVEAHQRYFHTWRTTPPGARVMVCLHKDLRS